MTLFCCKIRDCFKAGDGEVEESVGRRRAGPVRGLRSYAGRNVLYCAACWHSYIARLLREINVCGT